VIRGNNCSGNGTSASGGAGIHATGDNNRIEGNKCADADRGIDIDSTGNIIIRNTCSDNTTNWTIIAGNAYGPIVATPAGAAVNGNTAASALGSTDANANYSY
jgi:parallel beta-helix repeat protein